MSHFPFLGVAGWVGRVPPGIKEFINLPFLVLKARHPVIQESVILCVAKSLTINLAELSYNFIQSIIPSRSQEVGGYAN